MLGVYVHFPYCLARCPYCDFASQVEDHVPHEAYADAVIAELSLRLAGGLCDDEVVSVYFGGGTPSLWQPSALGRVLGAITEALPLAADAEITLEANPGASETTALSAYRDLGINRVSFGTQSFLPRVLEALGRWHTAKESATAVARARAAGFENVTLDLIYSVPGGSVAEARQDVQRTIESTPDHLSAYALTLEARVPMAVAVALGEVQLPGEDEALAIEEVVLAGLQAAGFERYEISNHARPGREAVHNTLYWTGHPYLGLGVSGSGYRRLPGGGAERTTNARSTQAYLRHLGAGRLPEILRERLSPEVALAEGLFCGLRLTRGVDLAELSAASGLDARAQHGEAIARLLEQGLVTLAGDRLAPTPLGLRFNDTLALAFIP